jgi:hypothetical protein
MALSSIANRLRHGANEVTPDRLLHDVHLVNHCSRLLATMIQVVVFERAELVRAAVFDATAVCAGVIAACSGREAHGVRFSLQCVLLALVSTQCTYL